MSPSERADGTAPEAARPPAARAAETSAASQSRQTHPGPGWTARVRQLTGDIQSWGPLAALIALCVCFSIVSPRFRTIENVQNIADMAVLLLVVATGLTFVLLTGAIDLSVEGVMAVSALSVALLVANDRNTNNMGLLGVAIAVGVGAGFGLMNGIINTRLRVPSFMVTLGTSSIGIGVATILYHGKAPGITDAWFASWALEKWFGFSRLTFVAIAVVVIGYLIQRYTRVGRYAYVIGGGEDVALLSGINVSRYKILLFALAGAAFGIAGVMSAARLEAGVVQGGAGLQFAGITAVVIGGTLLSGGRGGVLHSVVGALIITVLSDGMVLVGVSPYVQKALQGVLIVAAVVATGWPLRQRMRVIK